MRFTEADGTPAEETGFFLLDLINPCDSATLELDPSNFLVLNNMSSYVYGPIAS